MKEKIIEILKTYQIETSRGTMAVALFTEEEYANLASDINNTFDEVFNQEVEKRIAERIGSVESINYLLFDTALKCPHCGGDGFTVVPNYYTGEPEQEQCRWCWELEHYRSRLTCSEKPNNSQKTEGGEG